MAARLSHSMFFFLLFIITFSFLVVTTPASGATQPNSHSRIINGTPVEEGKYPWMVALLRREERYNNAAQFCGGTVIAPMWILTAAHCVTSRSPEQIEIGYGSVKLDEMSRLLVEEIITHTDFTTKGYRDIALLKLIQPVPASIEPIKLVKAGVEIVAGTRVNSIGWGATGTSYSSPGGFPDQLQEVGLEIGRTRICTVQNDTVRFLPQHEICIVAPLRDRLVCKGDSGGPSVARDQQTGDYYQVSIVSWSTANCDTHYATIQTKISGLIDWIERQTANQGRLNEAQSLPIRIFDYCAGKSCLFDASYARYTAAGKVNRYIWLTDDGASLSGADAVHFQHRFPRYGRHTVTLKLVYKSGRVSTRKLTFNLKKGSENQQTMAISRNSIGSLDENDQTDWNFSYSGYGFYHTGGLINTRIYSFVDGRNFDLELWNYNTFRKKFVRVARSVSALPNERIRRVSIPGFYSIVVRRIAGEGSYGYEVEYRGNKRDVCYLDGYLRCRRPKG